MIIFIKKNKYRDMKLRPGFLVRMEYILSKTNHIDKLTLNFRYI